MALYRAGDWAEAAATLAGVVRLSEGGGPVDWLFLAMARWRLGETDEARRWYGKAAAWRRVGGEAPGDELIPLFRAEAAGLLGVKDGEDKDKRGR